MSRKKRNRGQDPRDKTLFAPKWHDKIRDAVTDHSYLLSRGYLGKSALEMVGNRYRLNKRQQMALMRMSAADHSVSLRTRKACKATDLEKEKVIIDGFNQLILLENLLSGAYIFKGRDGCFRDISSVHGSYKSVIQTGAAIRIIGEVLKDLHIREVLWVLDRPVSNSGRLSTFLKKIAEKNTYPWKVAVIYNPDESLVQSEAIVISSDGTVLDGVGRWFNLIGYFLDHDLVGGNIFIG